MGVLKPFLHPGTTTLSDNTRVIIAATVDKGETGIERGGRAYVSNGAAV